MRFYKLVYENEIFFQQLIESHTLMDSLYYAMAVLAIMDDVF